VKIESQRVALNREVNPEEQMGSEHCKERQ
jgi:hypothetical protein